MLQQLIHNLFFLFLGTLRGFSHIIFRIAGICTGDSICIFFSAFLKTGYPIIPGKKTAGGKHQFYMLFVPYIFLKEPNSIFLIKRSVLSHVEMLFFNNIFIFKFLYKHFCLTKRVLRKHFQFICKPVLGILIHCNPPYNLRTLLSYHKNHMAGKCWKRKTATCMSRF